MAIDLALAGVGEDDELVTHVAADRAGFGGHGNRFQPHAVEGPQVGNEHLVVGDARVLDREVEGIGILHQEFAPAHHAEARPDLVAEFPLDMIEDARQLLVGLHAVAEDLGDQLLVGRAVKHLALMPVADAQHLLAIDLVAAAFLPDFRRLDGRHEQFERAGAVLLLANDALDLAQDPVAKGQPGVDAGARLPDEAGAQHQLVGDDLGFLRVIAQQGQEVAAEAHVGPSRASIGGAKPFRRYSLLCRGLAIVGGTARRGYLSVRIVRTVTRTGRTLDVAAGPRISRSD